eukprot:SAG22_NODE_2230_length_2811_cov_1.654499_2_plen_62_part_00
MDDDVDNRLRLYAGWYSDIVMAIISNTLKHFKSGVRPPATHDRPRLHCGANPNRIRSLLLC